MNKYLLIIALLVSHTLYSQLVHNMRLLKNLNEHSNDGLYSACWGYTANSREYAILGCARGTSFIDITDTTNIHEVDYVAGVDSATCCREMKTFSHYAYVVADGLVSGLQIIDLQYLPDSVRLVNTFFFKGFTRGHTIQQSGPYLYINAGDYNFGGLFVLDLTVNPVQPVKRGEWEQQVVHDCRVVNDTIFACNIYNPPGTISVIDARNKNNLTTITSWVNAPNPGPHNIAISPDRKTAFVTDEIGGNPRVLKIWDISNLNNVVKLSEWQPTGITTSIIHNVELYGRYLFAAHYSAGLRVIDVINPSNPVEAAWYDTYPANNSFNFDGCWGPYVFTSQKIIASDRQTGLYVLRTSFPLPIGISNNNNNIPGEFSLSQNFPNPFNPVTTIKYYLPYKSEVSLKVYDASGKEAAVLAGGFDVQGEKVINYDAALLPSGIYFYKLTAVYNNGKVFTLSRKMALVK